MRRPPSPIRRPPCREETCDDSWTYLNDWRKETRSANSFRVDWPFRPLSGLASCGTIAKRPGWSQGRDHLIRSTLATSARGFVARLRNRIAKHVSQTGSAPFDGHREL